jgi:hypothetical protein
MVDGGHRSTALPSVRCNDLGTNRSPGWSNFVLIGANRIQSRHHQDLAGSRFPRTQRAIGYARSERSVFSSIAATRNTSSIAAYAPSPEYGSKRSPGLLATRKSRSIQHLPRYRPIEMSDSHAGECGELEIRRVHRHRPAPLPASIGIVRNTTASAASMVVTNLLVP